MTKEKELKHSKRVRRHTLNRRKIIAGRLKAFGQKSIPIIINKPKERPKIKKGFWQKIMAKIK